MTTIPYQYIETSGLIVPDTGGILTDVQNEYIAALGADLVVTANTPQGVLITAETLARTEVVNNNAAVANQINPNIAGGPFLAAICALTGFEIDTGTPSTISGVTLAGVNGTIIPGGSQARTTDGNIFQSIADVTITGGVAIVDFQSVDNGPIPAPISSLNTIVTGTLGWETVNNTNAAVLGTSQQSDASVRFERNNTLALQGISLSEAITSGVNNIQGVRIPCAFRENVGSTTATIDGISLVGHSIYVCVQGGTDEDIAASLLLNKSGGCAWNGNTTVNTVDPSSGQTYEVMFQRPTEVPIFIRATVRAPSAISDPTDLVTQAILDYANGNIAGEAGFIVGGEVSCFELAGAVNIEQPSIFVTNMEISLDGITYQNSDIAIGLDQIATTEEGSIIVNLV